MKVAYVLNQYPMPSQTFIRREIAALERLGIEVERYSIRSTRDQVVDPDDLSEAERTRSVLAGRSAAARLVVASITTLARRPGRWFRALGAALRLSRRADRGVLVHLVYLAEACVLAEWLRRSGADHVHTHFGTNGPAVAMLVEELGGPPFSFTVHGPEEFDRPIALHLRDKVHAAAFVVVISSFGRSQMYRWSDRADWTKLHVVRCGLDAPFLDQDPAPLPDTHRLVCVGRLGEQKGQFVLVEAVGRLLAEGVDLEVVLAGDGPLRETIETAIDAAGARGVVRITGWIDNDRVRSEIQLARAMVLPSFAEGLPVAIMEALALGRPVITTSVAGIPELVDGDCGWVVPAGSVDALADALRDAIETPVERLTEMGARGRARVRERHDVDHEALLLAQLLHDAVGSRA